jgi:hypothetical protein
MLLKTSAYFIGLCNCEELLEGNNLNKIAFRKHNVHGNVITLDG